MLIVFNTRTETRNSYYNEYNYSEITTTVCRRLIYYKIIVGILDKNRQPNWRNFESCLATRKTSELRDLLDL